MLRVLLTRRWLAALAAALVFAIACLFLGRWQWHRYEVKHAAGARITAHYTATPVPLKDVLPTVGAPMTLARDWTRVQVSGRYDAAGQMLVRNRPDNSVYGYEVVVPLVLSTQGAGGSGWSGSSSAAAPALLVDRGWVANGADATRDPVLPPVPTGVVTVTGWLRPGEPDVHSSPRSGQMSSVNLAQAAAFSGHDLYRGYAIAQLERTATGATPVRAAPLDPPDTDTGEGVNLAYSFQWWLGCVAGFGLVFVGVRRQVRDEEWARSHAVAGAGGAPGGLEGTGDPDGAGDPKGAGDGESAAEEPQVPVLVPSRPKRHRIWDDEDE